MNRVKVEDDYNISDWYSASRESRVVSMAIDNQRVVNFQNAHNINPMPQNFYNGPPHQQYTTKPTVVIQPQPSPQHHHQPRLQPVHDHHQQRQLQQQQAYNPNGGTVRYNEVGSNAAYYGEFNDYNEKPTSSRSMGRSDESGYEYGHRPTTTSTVGSTRALVAPYPARAQPMQSRQQLLPSITIPSKKEGIAYSEPSSASSGYSPPSQPAAITGQYSATSQLSRNNSFNDRYTGRKAGGDSCCGECCESCCGKFMRCTCCRLHPAVSWLLVILVLIGIALGLYFNWSKIVNAVDKLDNTPSVTPATPATPDAAETPTTTDVINSLSSLISFAMEGPDTA
ncbi:hypothetical protein BX661DRAFT_175990 [Kickxella alabastrina]|uniref:uncharacterized protein n=1 Tax=Kickxella alabastrina TaxID=61397 RepID=UPI0022205A01|nr:uncharacterized protein BX661DRAFT_175990 [Kickxella alabastrina]KAI7835041.1 hypothetical protein BX661DRAFT_175990 [Kickxella alabastrina]KAJ1947669.1 hypothetical protein GGF37_000252 [Kickxella alabastrina]